MDGGHFNKFIIYFEYSTFKQTKFIQKITCNIHTYNSKSFRDIS